MATYNEIFGRQVKFLASDPSATAGAGQIWYNSVSNTFKTSLVISAWASGGSLTNKRRNPAQGIGPQTAAMAAGGMDGATALAYNEQYNGTAWSEGAGALNTARQSCGGTTAGTQTAALIFAGSSTEPSFAGMTDTTEEYDGSTWTTTPNVMNTARFNIGGCGTSTAALGFGGYVIGDQRSDSEEWNGTSWTEGDNMIQGRIGMGCCGIQTAALACNGAVDTGGPAPTGPKDTTEEYNGASWTAGGTNLVACQALGAAGTQTFAICFGGSPNITTTSGYDGTTWTTRPAMATGRDYVGMAGTATAALCIGGNAPSDAGVATVEEYNGTDTIRTLTTS